MIISKSFLFLLLCSFYLNSPDIVGQKNSSGNYKQDIFRLPLYESHESDSLITDTIYIRRLLLKAENENNQEAVLRCLIALSVRSREQGQLKSGFHQLEHIIRKAQMLNNSRMLMVAFNNYAVLCRRVDRLNGASGYHLQALKIAEGFSNKNDRLILKSKCAALNGLGNISLSLKQYFDALPYFSQAIKIEQELGSKVGMAINEANIGAVLELISLPDSALYHYKKALELNRLGKSAKGVAICLVSMGDVLASQGKYHDAIGHFGKALQITDSIGDVYHWLSANHSCVKTLIKTGRIAEAKKLALESVNKSQHAGIIFYLTQTYLLLSEIAEKEKDPSLALHYLKLGNMYKDSIEAESNFTAIQDLKLKYETEKKEQENLTLKKEQRNTGSEITTTGV
ncbi:MAG: tetratricopeptide repeat protein [Bacteroidetes bacterium]|nr:tetratricopeptide repeat protein [Bacteroidota bacterium]